MTAPLFLVGSERSGTTLLRLMLDHHPALAFEFEFEYAVDWDGPDDAWPDVAAYRDRLATHRIFQLRRYAIDRALGYPDLVRSFLAQRQARAGRPIVGATVHHRFDRLTRIWPDARFLHLIRDGRDVARSTIQMGWAGNVWTGIAHWVEAEAMWDRMRPGLGPDRALDVRYEDLVRDPEAVLGAICRFVGVAYDPAMLDYPADSSYGPPDGSLAEQWRRKLAPDELRLAEARAGAMLARRGYPLSGLPPLVVDAKRERALRRQCQLYRKQFRLRRYGAWLTAADFLARRLRLGPLATYTRGRMNAVNNALLK